MVILIAIAAISCAFGQTKMSPVSTDYKPCVKRIGTSSQQIQNE